MQSPIYAALLRITTSVEKEQDEGVEDEHEQKCIQDAQAPFYAVVNDVQYGVHEHCQVDHEQLDDNGLLLHRQVSESEVHEFEEGWVVIILPINLLFALGAICGYLIHVPIIINMIVIYQDIYF